MSQEAARQLPNMDGGKGLDFDAEVAQRGYKDTISLQICRLSGGKWRPDCRQGDAWPKLLYAAARICQL